MIGAIIGDIVGSRFEFVEENGVRGKDFAFFTKNCRVTDDSMMTLAIAKALFLCKGNYFFSTTQINVFSGYFVEFKLFSFFFFYLLKSFSESILFFCF